MIPNMADSDTVLQWDYYGPVGSACKDQVTKVPPHVVRKPVEEAREVLEADFPVDFYRAAHVDNAPVTVDRTLALLVGAPDKALKGLPRGKPTNPKDRVGSRKCPTSLMPQGVVLETGLAFLEGAAKGYGPFNWREVGVRASVYFDAVDRHLGAWWEGQDLDPDSGLSHVTKAIAGLMILRDSMVQGNLMDDRPVSNLPEGWMDRLNEHAAGLIDRYGDDNE